MKYLPDQKVIAGGIGMVLGWLVAMAVQTFAGIEISPDIQTGIAGVFGLVIAYMAPQPVKEIVAKANGIMADGKVTWDELQGLLKK